MKVVAFTGGMGVGKSTAVNFLNLRVPSFRLIKFAQPLYDMQEAIYDRISPVYTRHESFVKDRRLLQWLGTEWGRGTVSPSIWVDLWQEAVQSASSDLVVCDDCRFDNEAQTVRAIGGYVIKITSPHAMDRISTSDGIAAHASEEGVSRHLIDFAIDNGGTLKEFESTLCKLYRRLGITDEYVA